MRTYQHKIFSVGWSGAVKWLIIVNVIVYVFQMSVGENFFYLFSLVPYLVTRKLFLWQFVTYMFLHGGLFHIAMNLFVLWMFGKPIEAAWGTKEFLKYYIICGIGAGIFIFLTSVNSQIPVVGASGAIYGLLVAFAMLYPDSVIYLYFLFPIKAKHFAILIGVIAFLSGISGTKTNIAHFGHLGGLIVGYLYLKFDFIKRIFNSGRLFSSTSKEYKTSVTEERVNEILDKILLTGVESLTSEEKKLMDEYSRFKSFSRN